MTPADAAWRALADLAAQARTIDAWDLAGGLNELSEIFDLAAPRDERCADLARLFEAVGATLTEWESP